MHLLFRLFVVLLLGSLDGLTRPVLGRKRTLEHNEGVRNLVSECLRRNKGGPNDCKERYELVKKE